MCFKDLRKLYSNIDEILSNASFQCNPKCNSKCCKYDTSHIQPAVSPGEKYLIEEYLE